MKTFLQRVSSGALLRLVATSLLAWGALSGCSKRYTELPAFSAFPITDSFNHSVGRFKTSYLADQIHAYFRGNSAGPIGVATFVDLDNLYHSSSFGRMVGEQLMSELAMRGYNVVELRRAQSIQILESQGEFGLSREVPLLKEFQDLSGIIVGTYVSSPVRVYINARLIDPATSLILSAGSVEMSKTTEIARLLRNNSIPTSLERIPIRNLGYASFPAPYYWPAPPYSRQPTFDEEEFYPEGTPPKPSTDLPVPQLPATPNLEPNA